MHKITCVFFFVLAISACHAQTEKQQVTKSVQKAVEKQAADSSFPGSDVLDPAIIKQFKDSGQKVNGLKSGLWVEYSLDTMMMGQKANVLIGNKKLPVTLGARIKKQTGTYVKGQKEGTWTTYESYDTKAPFSWEKQIVANYKNGQKDGEETTYQDYTNDQVIPFTIRHWKNGIENGIGKIYDSNYPYKLRKLYKAVGGQLWLLKSFYPDGKPETQYKDTIINGKYLKFMEAFYDTTGQVKQTGYYLNGKTATGKWVGYYKNGKIQSIENYIDGNLNGIYQYYYDSGQLWTEWVYKDGKVWDVHANYKQNGQKQNPGTLKDGTGTLILYDEIGNIKEVVHYVDGVEQDK